MQQTFKALIGDPGIWASSWHKYLILKSLAVDSYDQLMRFLNVSRELAEFVLVKYQQYKPCKWASDCFHFKLQYLVFTFRREKMYFCS